MGAATKFKVRPSTCCRTSSSAHHYSLACACNSERTQTLCPCCKPEYEAALCSYDMQGSPNLTRLFLQPTPTRHHLLMAGLVQPQPNSLAFWNGVDGS